MKLSTLALSSALFLLSHLTLLGQNSFTAYQGGAISSNDYFESTDTMVYQPVCGADGKSYINTDEAMAAGLTEWTVGDCCSYEKITVENSEMAWIEYIVINDVELELPDKAMGYQDQTHQFFDLSTSQQNFLSLGGQSTSAGCDMKWSIWIDFNENHLFEASELVYEGTQTQEDIQLQLPVEIKEELVTRMRVMWTTGDKGQKRGELAIGEVADYSVFFQ